MSLEYSQSLDGKPILRGLLDSMAIVVDINCLLVQRHGDLIRIYLNDKYQQTCRAHIEFTTMLFGNDLPKQVQEFVIQIELV